MSIETQEDRKAILNAVREISASMSKMDAEREIIKGLKKQVCEDFDLERKVFNKLAKTYHKGNFSEEVESEKMFQDIYTEIVS